MRISDWSSDVCSSDLERVGSGGRTVALELGLVQTHLRDVLRDLHLGDALHYVHNVMNGHGFGAALSAAGMLEHRQALEVWLKDEIGSGSCRERVCHLVLIPVVGVNCTKTQHTN